MGKDRLEHFVNQSIGDYQSPIDTDELWANLQGSIPGKGAVATSAGFAAWKWMTLGVVAIVVLAGIGVYTWSNEEGEMPIVQEEVEIPSQLMNTSKIAESKESYETTSVIQGVSDDAEIIQVSSAERKKEIVVDEMAPSKATGMAIESTIRNTNNSDDVSYVQEAREIKNIETAVQPASVKASSTGITVADENTMTNTEEDQSASILGTKFDIATARNLVEATYADTDISLLKNVNGLSNSIGKPDRVTCPSFGNKRGGGVFIGELQLIPYYSSPIIKSEGIAGEQWKARKEATESYLEAFQINLIGRYQMNNGLYFQAGVGYGQIDEKFTFNSSDIEVTTEGDLPVIIILRPNGMSDTIRGNVEVTTETDFIAETYNYHRMIELPFAIGYEFNLNNSMGIYIDGGGSLNLSTFRKGYHIVDDVDVITFDNATRPVFKSTTGFKLNGSIGLRYYTKGGVTLSVGPDIRYHMGNWIRDEHPIELRYLDVGLRVGIGYAF